jgi:spermidine synthase
LVPRELLDETALPGGGTLRLFRRGGEYSIMLGSNELMNSRRSGSEEALADLVAARLRAGPRPPRVLIGGLGMGFTLRAALARFGRGAEIVVAELVPAVIAWARGPLLHLYAGSLDDRRVEVIEGDVAEQIAAGSWDAILLDVDNGPDAISVESNGRLYSSEGLADARSALRAGGLLALWSAAPDSAFAARLRRAGFAVEEHIARAARGRGGRHLIWLARK